MTDARAEWIDGEIGLIDLLHRGIPRLISIYLVPTSDGLALIETGPTNTIDNVLAGVEALGHDPADIRHVLLTHIHLDHAGGAGALLARLPDAQLYVHERGARHMIDPSRLLASAERIYGAQMDALWGPVEPCPAERVTAVQDGDSLDLGDLNLQVLYAPGHASHHVVFDDPARSAVYCGDVAGMHIPPESPVLPPTPPPDVDVEAWHTSINRIRDLDRERLLLAHFGPWDDPRAHLDELEGRLDRWLAQVAEWRASELDRQAIVGRFEQLVVGEIGDQLSAEQARDVANHVMPYGMSVDGMLHYLNQREDQSPTA